MTHATAQEPRSVSDCRLPLPAGELSLTAAIEGSSSALLGGYCEAPCSRLEWLCMP